MEEQLAIHNDLTISIKYFKDHDFHFIKDKISYIDTQNGYLFLKIMENIRFGDIIDVEIL